MTRTEFRSFVDRALNDAILLAEGYTGKLLPRRFAFRWLGHEELTREGISDVIVSRVYIDEDHIYPCVDLGVGDLLEDGTPVIVANVAGYSPRPFQKNWTGREGPFVRIIGQPFLSKLAGTQSPDSQVFRFLIPDMGSAKK